MAGNIVLGKSSPWIATCAVQFINVALIVLDPFTGKSKFGSLSLSLPSMFLKLFPYIE